jgi:hypothetical protein
MLAARVCCSRGAGAGQTVPIKRYLKLAAVTVWQWVVYEAALAGSVFGR